MEIRFIHTQSPCVRKPGRLFMPLVVALVASTISACGDDEEGKPNNEVSPRPDHAVRLEISLDGSLQNPAQGPNGTVVLTRWRNRYNEGAADIYLFDPTSNTATALVSDGWANVNLPGSIWDEASNRIAFSSDREPHDEIYLIAADGSPGDEVRVTDRSDRVAYEPSFSPQGDWVVFESHPIDVEDQGVITTYELESESNYVELTDAQDDCRQPNWSPAGDLILYQKRTDGRWDIWVTDPDGTSQHQLTSGEGDKTDASFSPNGNWVVYSSTEGGLEFANIFVIPVEGGQARRITNYEGYDGAPSWIPGGTILFESCPGDPDESSGTKIWSISLPSDITD